MSVRIGSPTPSIDRRSTISVVLIAFAIVLGTLAAVVLVVTVSGATAGLSPLPPRVHQAVVGLPVVLGFYGLIGRVLGVPPRWILAGRPDRRVLAWTGIGLLFPGVVLGLELWLTGAAFLGGTPSAIRTLELLAASLGGGLLAGVLEELAIRGALLRTLEAKWGTRIAVVGSAAVFAALHQGHAGGGLDLLLVLASMFAAGLLLGTVVARTRSVWNAVVLHAGWNTVFGGLLVAAQPVGQPVETAVLRFQLPADAGLLTGGTASLGAAPVTTVSLVIAVLVVLKAPRRWLIDGDRPISDGTDR